MGLRILDVGCGIGTNAIRLAKRGHTAVGIDVSTEMIRLFRENIPESVNDRVTALAMEVGAIRDDEFDIVLLNLVLDHLEDPVEMLSDCARLIDEHGRLIVVVPHPIKDSGNWERAIVAGRWEFARYWIDNYFYEGPIAKYRDDDEGNTLLRGLVSYKRTVSHYARMFNDAGFIIEEMEEPQAECVEGSANAVKASRLPYFLLFVCSRRADRRRDKVTQQ